jgi:hypothetical protein
MKHVFILSFVFLIATCAESQSNSPNASLLTMTSLPQLDGSIAPVAPATAAPASTSGDYSLLPAAPSLSFTKDATALTLFPGGAASTSPNPASPQFTQSVFQHFDWEVYAGYAFVRFYQVPGVELNTNGLNFGVVYYIKDWVGAEGEFTGTFGSQYGDTSRFLLGLGGLRFRWSAPRGIELWAHGLIGGSHYLPQTAYGSPGALGYELGGGVDINAHHMRWAYRFAVDAVATQYFSTYQFSPKASAGIVFRF